MHIMFHISVVRRRSHTWHLNSLSNFWTMSRETLVWMRFCIHTLTRNRPWTWSICTKQNQAWQQKVGHSLRHEGVWGGGVFYSMVMGIVTCIIWHYLIGQSLSSIDIHISYPLSVYHVLNVKVWIPCIHVSSLMFLRTQSPVILIAHISFVSFGQNRVCKHQHVEHLLPWKQHVNPVASWCSVIGQKNLNFVLKLLPSSVLDLHDLRLSLTFTFLNACLWDSLYEFKSSYL